MSDTLTPITREEHFLQAIADACSQGGGEGIPVFATAEVKIIVTGTEGNTMAIDTSGINYEDEECLALITKNGRYYDGIHDDLVVGDEITHNVVIIPSDGYLNVTGNYGGAVPIDTQGDCEVVTDDFTTVIKVTGDCVITFEGISE